MSIPNLFEPADRVQECESPEAYAAGARGDARDGSVYVYHHPDIALAVRVAQVTGRPLLVSGPSGSGKSSLALNVALSLRCRFYEYVVSSKTTAQDLMWKFDAVRRLNDAQTTQEQVKPDEYYIEPGPLWWAFDRRTAMNRGSEQDREDSEQKEFQASDPWKATGFPNWNVDEAVVLIDEIDKADADVPNNLLVPLGSYRFVVPSRSNPIIAKTTPLVFITTNGERELPAAFERRCVSLNLFPSYEDENEFRQQEKSKLKEIATAITNREFKLAEKQFKKDGEQGDEPKKPPSDDQLGQLADFALDYGSRVDLTDGRDRWINIAKYLDLVKASHELDLWPNGKDQQSENSDETKKNVFENMAEIILRDPHEDGA